MTIKEPIEEYFVRKEKEIKAKIKDKKKIDVDICLRKECTSKTCEITLEELDKDESI